MFDHKRFGLELLSASVLYGALLLAANWIADGFHPAGYALYALSMVPMIGAIAMAWAILRGLNRMDELQRRVQFDAIAFSFLGTALITFGWGFAEDAGLPHLRAFAVWPIMAALWVAGMIVSCWKYR
ncbi:hypothetical protein [Asaia astilbis]|uniref:hypothetical protein n=1 Tax=Asaia astilbis TaxID=610244 RepID=UPI00046EA32A|nr:hypothetical protein [Asaia astilbis]